MGLIGSPCTLGGVASDQENPHGNTVTWLRTIVCHSTAEKLNDEEGWQEIRLVGVDTLP